MQFLPHSHIKIALHTMCAYKLTSHTLDCLHNCPPQRTNFDIRHHNTRRFLSNLGVALAFDEAVQQT